MNTNNRKIILNKESEAFINLLADKEKISFNKAMNKLITLGFKNSYNLNSNVPKEEGNIKEKESSTTKEHTAKEVRKGKNRNPKNSAAANIISLVTLVMSAIGIFLGVIYVLYIKQ